MKIALTSDIHLGDPKCKLVKGGVSNAGVSAKYDKLRGTITDFTGGAELDYLVLAGDILDFSIASFEDACVVARPFFEQLKADRLTREIIYIPGNHDKHVWDAVEWETNIMMRLRRHRDPRPFRRTQPGVLDATSTPPLLLPDVSYVEGTRRYGQLFLEGLFADGETMPISVVYPNLYITGESGTTMVTHGHMLEPAWVLLSELLRGEPELGPILGVKELEEYNVPLTAMICTGVGQAGAVSRLFYRIAVEAKEGKATRLRKVLDRVLPNIDKLFTLPRLLESLDNAALWALRKLAVRAAEGTKDSRYDEEFFDKKDVRKRFLRFYTASAAQAEALGLAAPDRLVFGHTHEPISARRPLRTRWFDDLQGVDVELFNTGGWLRARGKSAELFLLDDGVLSSVNIT